MENKLTFIKDLGYINKRRFGIWKCNCGNELQIRYDQIKNRYSCKECSKVIKGEKIRVKKTLDNIVIGQKFNLLTVISEGKLRKRKNGRFFKTVVCGCDCGTIKEIPFTYVKNGEVKSCGCTRKLQSGLNSRFRKGLSPLNKTHGDSIKTSPHYYLHILWMRINSKCHREGDQSYYKYGKRGIKMFEEWRNDYIKFKMWILENIGERPFGLSLDRIDVNGNYEPGNLRWLDAKGQANNRRRELKLNVKGRKRSLSTGAVKNRYEKYYKIKVQKGNNVHHIDWDRDNNNPHNLLEVTTKQHGWLHRMENESLRHKTRDELIKILKQNNI